MSGALSNTTALTPQQLATQLAATPPFVATLAAVIAPMVTGVGITAETAARISGDATNTTAITAETTRAVSSEAILTAGLSTLGTTVTSHGTLITTNTTAITAETTRAVSSEAILTAGLSTLGTTVTSHGTLITTNATAISNEASRATGVEASLALAAITSGSITAVGSLTLSTQGGSSIPVVGQVGVTTATVAIANTGVGGAASGLGSVANGNLALSLNLPAVPGPPGGVAPVGTPKGGWNPLTNVPALATGGAGGVTGDTYIISSSGTLGTAIDGTTSVQQFGALINLGTSWLYAPPASVTGAVTSLLLPHATLLDDGSGVPGFAITGNDGGSVFRAGASGVDMPVARIATATVTNLTATNFTGPAPLVIDRNGNTAFATSPAGATIAGVPTIADASSGGAFELLTVDGHLIAGIYPNGDIRTTGQVVSAAGTLMAAGAVGTTFSAQDIANIDAIGLASSAKIRTRSNTTAMRGTAQYNMQMVVGQSRTVGTYGSPPLSTTQPLDVLMLGTCTRGVPKLNTDSTISTFTTIGDNLFHPAVAVGQVQGSAVVTPPRTGYFANISNVTVTGSNGGTISWAAQNPAIDATTVFQANDNFQCQGFTVATGNNANPSNAGTFHVNSVTASSIVFGGTCVATTAPESGITIAQANYTNYGEDPSLVANTEYRKQQLNQRGLLADPTRLNVVSVAGIAVVVPGQMPVAYGVITPYPYYFNRIDGAMRLVQSTAATGGNGYPAGTSCLQSIYVAAGGDESGGGVSKADFRGQLGGWLNAIVADATTVFGATQTAPPFVYSFTIGSLQLNDGRNPSVWASGHTYAQFNLATNAGNVYVCSSYIAAATTAPTGNGINIADGGGTWNYVRPTPAPPDAAPVSMGTLELFGCSPTTGYPANYAGSNPNWYIVGPEYYGPDRGAHGNNQAYQWTGCQIAKVRIKVELLGQGWLPCHIIGVYVRGSQILVNMHAPEPPLQIRSPYLYDSIQTYPDLGFSASDSGGALTITSAALAGQVSVLLNCSRAVNAASLLLRYADAANHSGNGMICDSDPWQPALTTVGFTLGSGQLLTDNFTAPVASPGPTIQVGKPFPLWNWLCPAACPGVAY